MTLISPTSGEDAGAPDAPPVSPSAPNEGYAWYVVGALALINMVSYIERQIPTLLFAPIKADFHLSDTQVSLLAGFAFVLFYVGFGLVIGRLADRSNRKRIIAIGAVLWSLATMACGLTRSFAQLFVARTVVGVGEATLGPSATSIISDYFTPGRIARALSVYTGAQYLGAGFALVVGGLAIQVVSSMPPPHLPFFGEIAPWQTTFVAVGLIGSLVLIPLIFVKEPVRRGLSPDTPAGKSVSFGELFAFMNTNRRTFFAHFAAFAISSTLGFGTVAWMPSYFIRVHHWAAHDIGYVYGLMLALLGAAGVVAGARFAEWIAARGYTDAYLRAPMISMAITVIPASLAPLMPTAELALAVLFVSTFLSSFPVAVTIAALQVVTPNQMRGQVMALFGFIANLLGVGLGPTFVALITDHVFHNEMMVGYSITTATLIITPITVLLLWTGLRPYRESLVRAKVWTETRPGA
ncbi:MAG TPA: MFS transporter [Rhizomicrobium sp.]|jgi:MFS family permease|nr:MFS transporter [Rhizomicrobium sp.]